MSRAKRTFDIVVGGVVLVATAFPMAVIAVIIRMCYGPPAIFQQSRSGIDGKVFTLYKFRTMTHTTDANGQVLPDGDRLTPLGRFLRSSSLDELPELLNVVRGDMSLVGPRPLLVEYLPLYSREQARRHDCRPGITGLAQVRGRNELTWDERFSLDTRYIDEWTFWVDLRILAETLLQVARRRGISHPGHATMENFQGAGATATPDQDG